MGQGARIGETEQYDDRWSIHHITITTRLWINHRLTTARSDLDMDLDRWIGIILMMLAITLGVKSILDSRRSDLVETDPTIYSCVMWIPAIISAIMFNFQKSIINRFNVQYICNDRELLNVLHYIFPKIPWRCDHFFEFGIFNLYDRGIIIMLDFFMVFSYIVAFLSILILDGRLHNTIRLRNLHFDPNQSRSKFSSYGTCVFFILMTILTFVYPVPIYPEFSMSTGDWIDDDWPVGLLSSYGIGAFGQTAITTIACYLMAREITVIRFRREGPKRT